MSSLRYLAPNAVTILGMVCGLLSLIATHEHRWAEAGYFIVWAALLDNIDGAIARALEASSSFGAQMDSFADFINFGVAPSFLIYVSLRDVDAAGFTEPAGQALLLVGCLSWVLANMIRLARFNVTPETKGMLFGVPTTLAAGVLVIWYLLLIKYSPASSMLGDAGFFQETRIFGEAPFPMRAWSYLPAAMIGGAALMVSSLPMPKLGGIRNKGILALVLAGVTLGYVFNALRIYPDLMAWLPTSWLVFFVLWGQVSPKARGLRPPRLFGDEHGA